MKPLTVQALLERAMKEGHCLFDFTKEQAIDVMRLFEAENISVSWIARCVEVKGLNLFVHWKKRPKL